MIVPDETLDYWADRFVAANLADVMSLEQFLTLAPALRERRITQFRDARHVQRTADRAMPDAALHGDRLIDPHRHGVREFRRSFFWRRRHHA